MKTAAVFYLIDTCRYSLNGSDRVADAAEFIRNCIPTIGSLHKEVKAAVITYGRGAGWLSSGLCSPHEFSYSEVIGSGSSDLGSAFSLLYKDLDNMLGVYGDRNSYDLLPIFILISYSTPTDIFIHTLNLLKENGWFKNGKKYAFGTDELMRFGDPSFLYQFTGFEENVFKGDKPLSCSALFQKRFRFDKIPVRDRCSVEENRRHAGLGVRKCRILKMMRRELAQANGISYLTGKCSEPLKCTGTCRRCDAELRYFYNRLENRRREGHELMIPPVFYELKTEYMVLKSEYETDTDRSVLNGNGFRRQSYERDEFSQLERFILRPPVSDFTNYEETREFKKNN